MFTTAAAFSIVLFFLLCFSLVWSLLIVLCATAFFLSYLLMIDRFPVVVIFILLCCSTLFAIAFWRDLKYVINVRVSNARNIFRSRNRDSSSGQAFLFN